MKNDLRSLFIALGLFSALNLHPATAFAQGTAFTYQGQLENNSSPASGTYNLTFSVFNTNTTGVPIGGPVTNNGVMVANGLFTVQIDFGARVFTGASNWLQIGVETNGVNTFTNLTPRQQLTPEPYAIYAENAGNLSGTLSASQLTSIGNTNVGGVNNFFVGPSGNATTSGGGNTAIGIAALASNTTGGGNTANGAQALAGNTSGSGNSANGANALAENTSGGGNTANGFDALYANTNGNNNTANGDDALYNNTSGSNNIALGYQAGYSINGGSSNIDIGHEGFSTDTNIIRIGSGQTSTFIAGVIQSPVFGGNVGIGTASSQVPLEIVGGNPGNPFPQLWVAAATNAPFGAFLRLDATGIANGKAYHIYSTGSSADEGQGKLCFQDYTDGKTILCLTSNGYVGINTTSPTNLLQVGSSGSPAYCNGTTWVNGSDRNAKEDFAAIQPAEVLAKVAALPITQWRYKVEKDGVQHLGPMAQDFHAAFGLNGGDDTHIATVDEEGVALAAIQGLNQKLEEQRNQLEQKQTEITELKQRLERLERMVNEKNGGGE